MRTGANGSMTIQRKCNQNKEILEQFWRYLGVRRITKFM